jgi:hypothetical protein
MPLSKVILLMIFKNQNYVFVSDNDCRQKFRPERPMKITKFWNNLIKFVQKLADIFS